MQYVARVKSESPWFDRSIPVPLANKFLVMTHFHAVQTYICTYIFQLKNSDSNCKFHRHFGDT